MHLLIKRTIRRAAFSLVELLVVVAIITTLAALILVAMRGMRGSSERAATQQALRQLTTAYTAYYQDHNQQLMPGYPDPMAIQPDPTISLGPGQFRLSAVNTNGVRLNAEDTAPYVWRLMPYVDTEWRPFLADYRNPQAVFEIAQELQDGIFGPGTRGAGAAAETNIGLAFAPSIGLNSQYLGGDAHHGNQALRDYNPWSGAAWHGALRASEIKNPARTLVFAPSKMYQIPFDLTDQGFPSAPPGMPISTALADSVIGSTEVRPPICFPDGDPTDEDSGTPQWRVLGSGSHAMPPATAELAMYPNFGGMPVDRWEQGDLLYAAFDGSTSSVGMMTAWKDPRIWQPFAAGGY